MSGSITTATTGSPTALLRPTDPSVYLRQMVYDPTWGDPSYTEYTGKRIVPPVGSIVKDPDGTPHWVSAIDPTTLYPTYQDFIVSDETINGISFYTTDNHRLSLYIDTRSTPYAVAPDGKLIVEGISPRYYRLARYPGTSNETIISQYYDTTGNFVSNLIPLVQLSASLNLWQLQSCRIAPQLAQNEEIRVDIIDETGMVVRTAMLFATKSEIVNDYLSFRPEIIGAAVTSNQMLADGTCYLYQNQAVESLDLTLTLTYKDGSTSVVPIGKDNTYIYGLNDFRPTLVGMKQPLSIRYVLGSNENADSSLIATGTRSIFKDVILTVVPNDLQVPVKISVIPIWNTGNNMYSLRYLLYRTDGSTPIDISPLVTITNGTLDTSSKSFGIVQMVTLNVDMQKVLPAAYSQSSIFTQNLVITFKPNTGYVHWLIQDSSNSGYVYGQDTSAAKRPIIDYDASRKQYFIPTAIFGNTAAFLESFYYQAAPPYDPTNPAGLPTPTHFLLRDAFSLSMLVAAPIAIDDYSSAFNIVNDPSGNYANSTVVCEFITMDASGNAKTLYGAAVDTSTGTYVGT